MKRTLCSLQRIGKAGVTVPLWAWYPIRWQLICIREFPNSILDRVVCCPHSISTYLEGTLFESCLMICTCEVLVLSLELPIVSRGAGRVFWRFRFRISAQLLATVCREDSHSDSHALSTVLTDA
jgi:hypothetical protein